MANRYYCIPDIHGMYDLLEKALSFIYEQNSEGGKIIFLGDYIDRGPDNDKVLDTVMNPPKDWEFICLLGNHEDLFIGADEDKNGFYDMEAAAQIAYSPIIDNDELMAWMKKLKLFHIEDKNVFAHANYDDSMPPEKQTTSNCVWPRFLDWEGYPNKVQGFFLTHGHTPRRNAPLFAPNRVNLDAGIYAYNRLVVAEYEADKKGPVAFHEFI